MARFRPEDSAPNGVRTRPAGRRRAVARLLVAAPVAAGHLLLLILAAPAQEPLPPERPVEPAVTALLLEPPPPAPTPAPAEAPAPPAPAAAASPARPASAPPLLTPRPPRRPPPADVRPLAAAPAQTDTAGVFLGEGALAGARVAGSGGGGGDGAGEGCDMVRRLQDALAADADIRAAVDRSHRSMGPRDGAILVWNGEWLRSPGQDGKGLAGVRQAIAMEVAFAPEACRAEPVRGLVVIALGDGPVGPKLALGTGHWRWSQLLSARR